jgi:transposase-like protein
MKRRTYRPEEKAWALQQLASPINRTVVELAKETGITTVTLRAWRNEAKAGGVLMPGTGKRNDRWTSADKFKAVLQTATMSEAEVAEYCRGLGIQINDLIVWRLACERANEPSEMRAPIDVMSVKRVRELQRELRRKEAALAEAAALLVLRKKADAIWGPDEAE